MSSTNLMPIQMFCPNCGRKMIGYKGDDGSLRIKCKTCRVVIFSKHHTPKVIDMKIVASNN